MDDWTRLVLGAGAGLGLWLLWQILERLKQIIHILGGIYRQIAPHLFPGD